MRCVLAIVCLGLVAVVLGSPTAAQEAAATPGIPKTDQQKSGEAVFYQNCTLCHVYSADKKRYGIQASTQLIGLFKKPGLTDDAVRAVILTGFPGRMPSFRYTLAPREIDDLIAYLKIR